MPKNSDRAEQRIANIKAQKPVEVRLVPAGAETTRIDPRVPVYREGRLILTGGSHLRCVIVDLSRNGARIELDSESGLPEFVSLKVVVTDEVRRARVAWTRENTAGLSFVMGPRGEFGNAKLEG